MDPLTRSLAQLSVHPKKKLRFFDLPGEIRNQIYYYIAASLPKEIDIDRARADRVSAISKTISTVEQPKLNHILLTKCFPGITFANKQVCAEIVPILVANTRFILQSDANADEFNQFLDYSNTRKCVQSLAFPRISRPSQNLRFTQPALFQSCRNLRELSMMLDSDALMPFFGAHPVGETQDPDGNVTVTWRWGLPTLNRLPKLENFRMRCEIKSGQAVTYDAFEDVADWIDLHFRSDVVLLGNGSTEERQVRQRHVKFTGSTGHVEVAVWSWTIVRKV